MYPFEGQISLFETSDNAQVHILEKTVCATFNDGAAIMGITDYTGTKECSVGYPNGHRW